jgi:hypothetical protein
MQISYQFPRCPTVYLKLLVGANSKLSIIIEAEYAFDFSSVVSYVIGSCLGLAGIFFFFSGQ